MSEPERMAREHADVTRRYFLELGAAGAVALSTSRLWAEDRNEESERLLREVPHRAVSLAEDIEYGIELARAGHRVAYVAEAWVRSDGSPTAAGARSQRARWEDGRRAMARRHALPLLRRGLARREPILVDLALDLLVPPLSTLCVVTGAGAATALLASWAFGVVLASALTWSAAAACLFGYVARGWQVSGTGLRGLEALLHAPAYVVWKLRIAWTRRSRRPDEWVRTARERAT